MKIHCLCLTKDEVDILAETVNEALRWADTIVIADNGSTDGTLDVIETLARNPKVIWLKGFNKPFTDELRGEMYQAVKHISSPGDWWCRLDSDEIYIDNPREFLARMQRHIDTVWSSHFSYRFTVEDVERYEKDPSAFLETPVRNRFHYYLNDGSEPRFVRHRFPFKWRGSWPNYRFFSSTERIRLKQFQYRSPNQITSRLKNRQVVFHQSNGRFFIHEENLGLVEQGGFMQRVVPVKDLDFDNGGPLHERPETLPDIWPLKPHWSPCLPWAFWQMAQRVLHVMGLKKFVR